MEKEEILTGEKEKFIRQEIDNILIDVIKSARKVNNKFPEFEDIETIIFNILNSLMTTLVLNCIRKKDHEEFINSFVEILRHSLKLNEKFCKEE